MLKKSLIFGSIVLLLAMLFALAGCEGPVGPAGPAGNDGAAGLAGNDGASGSNGNDGQPGSPGDPGTPGEDGQSGGNGKDGLPGGFSVGGATVYPVDLEVAFSKGDIVILQSSVTSVYGEVPAGKTLYVLGENTDVASGEKLAVSGTLNIWSKAILNATGVSNGYLTTEGADAVIEGNGSIILPYALDTPFDAGLHYTSPEVSAVTRYPGSVYTLAGGVTAFNAASVTSIFNSGVDELTVKNVTNITSSTIPAGKRLTLVGTGNTLSGANFLLGNTSSLTVAEGATLTQSSAFSVTAAAGATLTNNGIIALTSTGASVIPSGETVINNGTITTGTSTATIMVSLLGLPGSGKIESTPSANLDMSAVAVGLGQNLVIKSNTYVVTLPNTEPVFTSHVAGNTITIEGANTTVALGVNPEGFGIRVKNGGIITTATTSSDVLETIFGEIDNSGVVTATGVIATLTDKAASFEIPTNVTLNLGNAGSNFGIDTTARDILVNGKLNFTAAVIFNPAGNVTVTGSLNVGAGTFTVPLGKVLTLPAMGFIGTTGKVVASAGTITIGELEGYKTEAAGVLGNAITGALTALATAREKLTDNIQPDINFGDGSVVGTIEFSANGTAAAVTAAETPTIPANPSLSLPAGITMVTGTGGAWDGANNVYPTVNTFAITIGTGPALFLADTGFALGVDKFDIISFRSLQLVHSNLRTPVLPEFHIGVHSRRTS